MEIQTQKHEGQIRVPSQAVMSRPIDQLPADLKNSPELERGKSFATVVFRCVDGKAVMTPVTVGASDDTHTIIKSGLKANEPVIAGPYKILESLTNDQVVKTEARGRQRRRVKNWSVVVGCWSQPQLTADSSPKMIIRLLDITKHYQVGPEKIRGSMG